MTTVKHSENYSEVNASDTGHAPYDILYDFVSCAVAALEYSRSRPADTKGMSIVIVANPVAYAKFCMTMDVGKAFADGQESDKARLVVEAIETSNAPSGVVLGDLFGVNIVANREIEHVAVGAGQGSSDPEGYENVADDATFSKAQAILRDMDEHRQVAVDAGHGAERAELNSAFGGSPQPND